MKTKEIIIEVISGLFVLLFIYAAVSKVADFQKFEVQLGKSPMLAPFVNLVTWTVPTLEIIIAILLTFKRFQLMALYLSFSLMVVFTAYIIVILNFSEYVPCSCGGILQNMTWRQHLIFNIVFIVIGFVAVLIYPTKEQRTIAIGGAAENLETSRH